MHSAMGCEVKPVDITDRNGHARWRRKRVHKSATDKVTSGYLVKGRGFSRAVHSSQSGAALAVEEIAAHRYQRSSSVAKSQSVRARFSARLKARPFKTIISGPGFALRMGFRYAKGLPEQAAQAIVREREKRPFESIADLANRVPELRRKNWCCWLRLARSIRLGTREEDFSADP